MSTSYGNFPMQDPSSASNADEELDTRTLSSSSDDDYLDVSDDDLQLAIDAVTNRAKRFHGRRIEALEIEISQLRADSETHASDQKIMHRISKSMVNKASALIFHHKCLEAGEALTLEKYRRLMAERHGGMTRSANFKMD